MAVCIGTTTAPYKASDGEDLDWIRGSVDLIDQTLTSGVDKIYYFAALEVDDRGISVYQDLLINLRALQQRFKGKVEVDWWSFTIDDRAAAYDSVNRLYRICTGRNFVHEYCQRNLDISHLLFVDSDLQIPADSVVRLMEMGKHLVAGDVPSYCLHGPVAEEFDFPVETHWNTAGFLLLDREVIRRVRWRWDSEAEMSDDPCFAADVNDAGLGPTFVRKDLIGLHRSLIPMEERGHDRGIRRPYE